MTTEERIAIIRKKGNDKKQKEIDEATRILNEINQLKGKIAELTDRIQAIIALANECVDNDVEIYVENGKIVRGTKDNPYCAAYVYRYSCQYNCWIIEEKITPAAFVAGVRRGTIDLF